MTSARVWGVVSALGLLSGAAACEPAASDDDTTVAADDDTVVDGHDWVDPLLPGPVALQLHLHGSLSEGNAPMGFHARQAERTLTDLLWWTDHDYFFDLFRAVTESGFETGTLTEDYDGVYNHSVTTLQWQQTRNDLASHQAVVNAEAAAVGSQGWDWTGQAPDPCGLGWCEASWDWVQTTPGLATHRLSLLGGASLRVRVRRDQYCWRSRA